ncbi:menaquinone biosynthesis protein [Sporomusa sp.]|uniref:menaquinone biosynthetic enzyme MqnA/MqnD family protein n=1 Tax=Sporomusa sp. TaxID=2078658 RepID=UPI002D07C72D|nr:menaquinone biosynthesis protein [Sporomusa sp.]HWR41836.1 menaquinone biosynthesis protein [Sporomusa sp.]
MIQEKQVRLGHIDFINCLPLAYGLRQGGLGQGLDIVAGPPSMLNQLILEGQLDVSPVSSIIYANNCDKFLILPDVSISANGFLQSILLVSKRPINELKGARVALTAKSATSHTLLKIIMENAYHVTPEYFVSSATRQTEALTEAEAVLFIGDDALYTYHNQATGYYYYDMGQEWRKLTGQAMVYALWVVRREFAAEQPGLLRTVYERVAGGFAHGLNNLLTAANTLDSKAPFNTEQITTYLQLLNYQLTPDQQAALVTYYKLAYGLRLIEHVPSLNFADVGVRSAERDVAERSYE